MFRIIQSAKVAKCDQTGELGIIIDGKIHPLGGGGADWNASEGEAGYVKNRTHYEVVETVNEPLNITWDGNTEGLVTDSTGVTVKISDAVPTDEQFATCEYGRAISSSFHITTDDLIPVGDITLGGELAVVRKAGAVIPIGDMSTTFPETGIYAAISEDHLTWLTSTAPVPHTKTVVHKLDKKFLPDDVFGGATVLYFDAYEDGEDKWLNPNDFAIITLFKDVGCNERYTVEELLGLKGKSMVLCDVNTQFAYYLPISYILEEDYDLTLTFTKLERGTLTAYVIIPKIGAPA